MFYDELSKGAVTRNNFSSTVSRKKKLLQVARTMFHFSIAMQPVRDKLRNDTRVWRNKVARAMLHLFLLCNVKKFVAETKNDS